MSVPDPRLLPVLERLRASRFSDLRGARLTASIPIAGRLLNEIVGAALPPSLPVRDLHLQPHPGNRIGVRARLARVDFLPPLNVTAAIERQPELPDGPLVLRLLTFPGLISLLGAALPLASKLPPGVRLDRDRVYVDLKAMAERQGYGDLLPLVAGIRLTTGEDSLIVELDIRI
jgi:hypothetical protein